MAIDLVLAPAHESVKTNKPVHHDQHWFSRPALGPIFLLTAHHSCLLTLEIVRRQYAADFDPHSNTFHTRKPLSM